jgi:hypothetical protein
MYWATTDVGDCLNFGNISTILISKYWLVSLRTIVKQIVVYLQSSDGENNVNFFVSYFTKSHFKRLNIFDDLLKIWSVSKGCFYAIFLTLCK